MIDTAFDSYDLILISVPAVVHDDIYVTHFGKEVLPESWCRLIADEYLEALLPHCGTRRIKVDSNDPRAWPKNSLQTIKEPPSATPISTMIRP